MVKLLQCHEKGKWDDYVLENGCHPLQLWGWGETKAVHGWSVERLFLYNENDQIIGAAQVLFLSVVWPLRSLAYIPRGPVVTNDNRALLLEKLADYVKREHHSVALTIEPDSVEFVAPAGWIKSKNTILPALTVVLDLKNTEAELLNSMAKKTRQYIRKSASEDMKIKKVHTHEELEKCLALYHATAERAKFNLHDDKYYYDVFDRLGEHSQLLAAYVDGQPAAFLWLAISADVAFELYGGMDDIGQRLRLNYALKWYAIRKCKEWGLSRYDFGGLIDGGVSTFKMGWTEAETELAGTFDMPLSAFYVVWNKLLPIAKKIVRKAKSLFK